MPNEGRKSEMHKLTTNGLLVPVEFPAEQFEAVNGKVAKKLGSHAMYDHFGGAWNSLAYRYCGAVDSGLLFVGLLEKHGTTPEPQERYLQEKAIFEFFSSGFSVFESFFYGMYSIGAFIDPVNFVLTSPRDQQRVSPSSTKQAYDRTFAGNSILVVFDKLFADPDYQRWREIRNILTHRTAPGRRIYVSLGSDDMPPVEWKLNNTPLNASIVSDGTRDLSRILTNLITGAATFVKSEL
jgi:hypothetical protein